MDGLGLYNAVYHDYGIERNSIAKSRLTAHKMRREEKRVDYGGEGNGADKREKHESKYKRGGRGGPGGRRKKVEWTERHATSSSDGPDDILSAQLI